MAKQQNSPPSSPTSVTIEHKGRGHVFLNKLTQALARNDKIGRDSMVLQTLRVFTERQGGYEGIANYWIDVHKRVEESGSAHVKVSWAKFLYECIGKIDAEEQESQRRKYDPDEMHAIMVGCLIEEITKDNDFARLIGIEVAKALLPEREMLADLEEIFRVAREEGRVEVPRQLLLDD